nr:PAS domain-containing sensor histidine kinase [uncultured Methanoregula sp.]
MSGTEINRECLFLYDHLHIGILVVRKDHTICFWNRCLEEWTGIKRDDVKGASLFSRFPQLDTPSIRARFPAVFEQGPPVFLSSRFHPNLIPSPLPDGSLRVQKGSILPFRLEEETFAMLVIEDVTDQVHQVTEYRRMRDIARQELSERMNAQIALRIANAKLSLFSDITLQDIRSQVVAARGFDHLLRMNLSSIEKSRTYSEKIDGQLALIEKYVTMMLEFVQLGAAVPTWQLLDPILRKAKLDAQLQNLEIGSGVENLEIFAPPLLDRIAINLLENAQQHGENPEVLVKISFREEPEYGVLLFEDNGAGVKPEDKIAIFKPGFGTKVKLSLYHTREILAITGITIDETGMFGTGARFEMRLPKDTYRYVHT